MAPSTPPFCGWGSPGCVEAGPRGSADMCGQSVVLIARPLCVACGLPFGEWKGGKDGLFHTQGPESGVV